MEHILWNSRHAAANRGYGTGGSDSKASHLSCLLQFPGLLDERRLNVFAEQAFQFLVRLAAAAYYCNPILLQFSDSEAKGAVRCGILIPPLAKVLKDIARISNDD